MIWSESHRIVLSDPALSESALANPIYLLKIRLRDQTRWMVVHSVLRWKLGWVSGEVEERVGVEAV